MLVEVGAPDVRALYDEALGWSDPDLGLLTIIVPPIVDRLSNLLGPTIELIGGAGLVRASSGEAQAVENAIARLRAHGVHTLVILHGHWLPKPVLDDLVAAAALADLALFVVGHPEDGEDGVAPDWRTARWGWAELRAWVAGGLPTWRAFASTPERQQRVAFPPLGLRDPLAITGRPPTNSMAEATFRSVRERLGIAPPVRYIASIVRQALRSQPPAALDGAREGVAAALAEAGYELLQTGSTTSDRDRQWRDLRAIADTTTAATLTLAAIGLDEREAARLRTTDVSPAGDRVTVGSRTIEVPPAARPYLRAQAFVRAGDPGALLFASGHSVGPLEVRGQVIEGLRRLGLTLDPRAVDGGISPSQRWLLARGLLVRRTRLADVPRQADERDEVKTRRCRHGLPGWIAVAASSVSHSQHLCRSRDVEEARPPDAGYRTVAGQTRDGAARYKVMSGEGAAGTLWHLQTPLGELWVQSMGARTPRSGAVRAAVLLSQSGRNR